MPFPFPFAWLNALHAVRHSHKVTILLSHKLQLQILLIEKYLDLIPVIGHGIGGKYTPIMARLAEARHWSKRRQTCLSSPDLTAIHNE